MLFSDGSGAIYIRFEIIGNSWLLLDSSDYIINCTLESHSRICRQWSIAMTKIMTTKTMETTDNTNSLSITATMRIRTKATTMSNNDDKIKVNNNVDKKAMTVATTMTATVSTTAIATTKTETAVR